MIRSPHRLRRSHALGLAALGLIFLLASAGLSPSTPALASDALAVHSATTGAATSDPERLSLDAASATPRPVEESTAQAIQRDYAHAWQSLLSALEENRTELLDENFVGGARQHWQDVIHAQQQNGLSRRILDRGHHLRVTFYSLDGSALQAVDSADLEIEYRDGPTLLSSERVHADYLLLLTPAENSWKLRILQELPPGGLAKAP